MGFSGFIGPFFFDDNVTGDFYLGMLQTVFFPPFLELENSCKMKLFFNSRKVCQKPRFDSYGLFSMILMKKMFYEKHESIIKLKAVINLTFEQMSSEMIVSTMNNFEIRL